jgi:hypothetical protein
MVRDQFNSAHRLTTCAAVSETGTPRLKYMDALAAVAGHRENPCAQYCIELELGTKSYLNYCVSWTRCHSGGFRPCLHCLSNAGS